MPTAAYPTLREVFLRRVIQNEAVRRERDAAMEEARKASATVPPNIVELFLDHGMLPGDQVGAWSPYWSVTTEEPPAPPAPPTWAPEAPSWTTGPHEPLRLPTPRLGPVLTFTAAVERALRSLPLFSTPALERATRAALAAWAAMVRELRTGTLAVTGKKIETAGADRLAIGPETWLRDDLRFDVRENTLITQVRDGTSRRTILWSDVRVRNAVKRQRGWRKSKHSWEKAVKAVEEAVKNGPIRRVRSCTQGRKFLRMG